MTRVVIEIPGRSFRRGEVQRPELLTLTRAFEASGFLFTKNMSDWVLGHARGEWPASTTLDQLPASRYPEVLVPEVYYLDGAKGEPFDRGTLSEEEIRNLDDLLLLDRTELIARSRRGEPILA